MTIATTVRASGDATVPISFGYHPYLRLPGVDRSDWEIEIPVRERLRLDRRMLPTGEREAATRAQRAGWARGRSTTPSPRRRTPAPFVLAGGGRRIEVSFVAGYPYAQVYAPADDDVVALEPMTAPDQRVGCRRARICRCWRPARPTGRRSRSRVTDVAG